MPLGEPATTLTDYALAITSLFFAVAMARVIGPRTRVTAWFWCGAFIAAAVAAAAGGTYHGFAHQFDAGTVAALWNFTMFAMGASGAFMAAGIHAAHVRRADGTVAWLAGGIAVTLLGAAVQQGVGRAAVRNPNAAYHLIQMIALYCFYRCARTVRDRPAIEART